MLLVNLWIQRPESFNSVSISVLRQCFFFQAEDGIRALVRSRGLGDVYKRQGQHFVISLEDVDGRQESDKLAGKECWVPLDHVKPVSYTHLMLPTIHPV